MDTDGKRNASFVSVFIRVHPWLSLFPLPGECDSSVLGRGRFECWVLRVLADFADKLRGAAELQVRVARFGAVGGNGSDGKFVLAVG